MHKIPQLGGVGPLKGSSINKIILYHLKRLNIFLLKTTFRIIENICLLLHQNKCQNIRTPPLPSYRATPTLLAQVFQVLVASLTWEKTITKPLINSTFSHGLPVGLSYPVLTIIRELLRQFKSWRGLLPNCIIYFMFGCLK